MDLRYIPIIAPNRGSQTNLLCAEEAEAELLRPAMFVLDQNSWIQYCFEDNMFKLQKCKVTTFTFQTTHRNIRYHSDHV